MRAINKQLTILSDLERAALYERPSFNYEQRLEYFTLTDQELRLALSRKNLSSRIHCILQIGYFKAVKMFYRITLSSIDPEDYAFIIGQYFDNQKPEQDSISKYEYYTQIKSIAELFEYKLWSGFHQKSLHDYAVKIALLDINPQFITIELLSYLQNQKVIRPGYTTLQTVVSSVINAERKRLSGVISKYLTIEDKELLETLLIEEDSLSKLAAVKQDAKNFKLRIMERERQKMLTLKPIYQIIKRLMPYLKLSGQNMHHYANLINYYNIYDLRKKLKIEQTYLYLLCYTWKRYQQINDNLVDAFCYHFKQIDKKIKERADTKFSEHVISRQDESQKLKLLARLYVDDTLPDEVSFGIVRQKAFKILPKDELLLKLFDSEVSDELAFYWQSVDTARRVIRLNLHYLATSLEFCCINQQNPYFIALEWLKTKLSKFQKLTLESTECPSGTVPKKLRRYLISTADDKSSLAFKHRYEYWLYRKLYENLKAGTIYLEDSLKYRSLSQELVSLEEKEELIKQLNISVLTTPIANQLDSLFTELHQLWSSFNKALNKNKLKHLRYDEKDQTLHLRKVKVDKEEQIKYLFYKQLPFCDVVDVIKFVNKHCGFLSAFTHIQPRYAKHSAREDYLIATIIAQGMNNGNLNMSAISNIPYSGLQDTLQSYIRLATLKVANDIISNNIARLPIFPLYSFDFEVLYGSVDGQKFEAETPTIKTRYSKKYFGKGKGIVAYTLLANHIPLQTELIGANEHESYFLFDIWYNNTADISPDIITGDMHSINRANFAIMHWFGGKLYPRFTDIEAQRKHLYCSTYRPEYKKYLIQPVGEINRKLIESEWHNAERIIATLGLKEITQSTLIKKLCTYKAEHRTRKSLFEFDKLIRSIHILKYLLDQNIGRNTYRSQNRIESYHQLRAAIAEAYGKKQIIGKTDIELEISNQCARLIANTIIYYNSAILSKIYEKHKPENNQKLLNILKKISPIAWQHIHFQGHLIFSNENTINLDEIIKGLTLDIKMSN